MIYRVKDILAMHEAIAEFCRFLTEQKVPSDSVFNSKLVVSELVGNVLRHTDGEATFHGEIKDGFIELSVCSPFAFIPPKTSRQADVYAEHGRGLFLVDKFCTERTTTEEGGILVRIRIE